MKVKIIKVNKELDIRRSREYKEITERFTVDAQRIKSWVSSQIHAGKILEREYNIRKDAECQERERETINKYAGFDIEEKTRMVAEIERLAKENVALKKALKESRIQVIITDTYRNDKEEI